MKSPTLNETIASLGLCLILIFAATHASGASSTLLEAKKEAEAKGYIFFTTHDEIVAKAEKEVKLKVGIALEPTTYKPLINGFRQQYPFFTDVLVEEIQGTDAYQRFILEMKAGQAKGWDIAHVPLDYAKEYPPYLMKYDILGMAKHGVLKIDPRMIHPVERNILSVASTITVVPYNKKLISEDKVPRQWEDFLKPEFKGKKFALDLRPNGVPGMVSAWGLERTLDFARKLAAQQPVWGSSNTRIVTAMAAGEVSLYVGANFNSLKRVMAKDPTGNLGYRIIEPVPVTIIGHPSAILNTADHPHAALLWYEFIASPEGQEIIDKYDLRASVFTPGSVAEQMTRGKKLSVVDWDYFTKFQEYTEKIYEAFGFPKLDK